MSIIMNNNILIVIVIIWWQNYNVILSRKPVFCCQILNARKLLLISRYYYWYPIDYSPAPLYCYLFKQVSYLIFMNKLLRVLLLKYFQHYLLFLHSVPMRTMSRWLRLWSEVDIQATTSLTATTSTTLSPGWLLLLNVTFSFAGRMCVRWKLALLGLLSDEQGRLQGGECLIQMMNIDVCHTIRANWQAIHRESNSNA